MTKLLVVGGSAKAVEVVNLDNSNPFLICDDLSALPDYFYFNIAFLYNGITPTICNTDALCYSFENGAWHDGPDSPRVSVFSIITEKKNDKNHDIVIMVGDTGKVESFDGIQWSKGVYDDLPEPLLGHCMVKINDTLVMVIGGVNFNDKTSKASESYFFHVIPNKWMLGPKLIKSRRWPSCGVMNWRNYKVIVVAGGYELNSLKPLTSVEFLFLNEYGHLNISWVEGVSLPHIIKEPVMVEFDNGVMLVGGEDNLRNTDSGRQLFLLSSPNATWTRINKTLKETRLYHSAFLVPDEIVNCHL